ncbi:major facilitator transporter [Amycolatopsis mediterranei S699]|uniref:Major facilitator transporter n=2 Tax=Amycolatopsis mediterranei TaxID=33910 RepID=A0A0H3D022_AMYMU|nr:MFS transporter [Amycolatopsis mediterranei]ADJ43958.1 major facilitator transporter [Amycolatopsis mediterranei U32]AEK40685.1 major facilitator transporter [Amycolatopsis mediterranei S699]AFO75671.1 major facilitator transporter [Amycolatopsis mediterranei S699]AGT82800.1 major facilitator transporter [Amycolatopsis mediterranei RB]KDO04242.1 major facilitator transporter [Amycolatopsis mediterranei]
MTYEPDPRRWKALAVSLTAGFMGLLDVSIVNVALPSMQSGLHASSGGIRWVVSGYALAFGLVLVTGGRLGDAFGRRNMFLGALAAFVLTSALAGAAPNETTLVLARLAQGVAAGMLTPQNTGLIQDLFRGAERGRAFGMFGAVVGISTAVGPILGGFIIAVFGAQDGWRWVFYVNVPIGVLAFVLALRLLPRSEKKQLKISSEIDFVGIVLLAVAVLGVLLPVIDSDQGGLRRLWWLFLVALVFGVAFVRWEHSVVRRGRSPLLDTRLFTGTPGYAAGAAVGALYFCGFAGIWLVFAIYFQQGLGYSPLQSGLSVTPFALGSAVSAAVAGRLVPRFGRRLTVTGLGMVAAGLLAVALLAELVPPSASGWAFALPLVFAGVGGGMVISPNTTLTLECVPVRMAGVAGGALQTGQRIGTAIGTAVLASVFGMVLGHGYSVALTVALSCAAVLTCGALALALAELRARRHRASEQEREARQAEASAADVHRG